MILTDCYKQDEVKHIVTEIPESRKNHYFFSLYKNLQINKFNKIKKKQLKHLYPC